MRLLANENFPGAAVAALADAGHDVAWIRTEAPGMKDVDVLAWAAREDRILVTFDQDFRELARQFGLPPRCGIILFRIPFPPARNVGQRLSDLISARADWAGHFSVIEPARVRMRRLARQL